ncbi:MAG: alpha/beta hydrolase [Tannerella sp.]|jgi:acetyl esterase/lipase|nr:alpha/beta hydrolase [Tannerella sp.]
MNKYAIVFMTLVSSLVLNFADAQKIVNIWEGNPPTNSELTGDEVVRNEGASIGNVTTPTLEIRLPDKNIATGMAVIICPGGGYSGLAYNHEGLMVAEWLNKEGIAAFILKYRMPNKHKEIPIDDAWQAIRHVRGHAAEYGVNPSKIGICGFSAGGHLAATASTHTVAEVPVSSFGGGRPETHIISVRPDFSILFYPVITMTEFTNGGSRDNLLGEKPSNEDIYVFSNEKQVNSTTPPAILFLSDDDKVVVPENSIKYYEALKNNGIRASLYIFPTGGHGWGFRDTYAYHKQMTELLSAWLKGL